MPARFRRGRRARGIIWRMATAPSASVREPAAAASRNGDVMLWRSALVASILICAAYAAVAPGHVVARNVLYNAADLGAIVAIVVGVRRYRPSAPHAWLLVAGGIFMFWIGDSLWAVYEVADRNPHPSPPPPPPPPPISSPSPPIRGWPGASSSRRKGGCRSSTRRRRSTPPSSPSARSCSWASTGSPRRSPTPRSRGRRRR